MPLKPCRECGAEVPSDAETCPECHAEAPLDYARSGTMVRAAEAEETPSERRPARRARAEARRARAEAQVLTGPPVKSKPIAFLFWVAGFIGLCGLHRLYNGRIGTGLLWLFTLGLLGVGQLVDLFLVSGMVDAANYKAQALGGAAKPLRILVEGPAAPGGSPGVGTELERLAGLMERGHLTPEEYQAQKARLLA